MSVGEQSKWVWTVQDTDHRCNAKWLVYRKMQEPKQEVQVTQVQINKGSSYYNSTPDYFLVTLMDKSI